MRLNEDVVKFLQLNPVSVDSPIEESDYLLLCAWKAKPLGNSGMLLLF